DAAGALNLFSRQYDSGAEPEAFCDQLLSLARDVLMVSANVGCDVIGAGYSSGELGEFTASASAEQLLNIVKSVGECLWSLPKSANKRIDAELCIYSLCTPSVSGGNAALAARVAAIEKKLENGVVHGAKAEKTEKDRSTAGRALSEKPAEKTEEKACPEKKEQPERKAQSERFSLGKELVKILESRLDPVSASCLGYCSFKRSGNLLCIVTGDSIAYEMLNNREILSAAAEAAGQLEPGITGAKIEMQKTELRSPSGHGGGESDNMDLLVSFMNENSDISDITR
ncbi:MAG: hypothetical protein ACI4XQ_08780, partial [Eubacteriales bacterium]